MTYNLHVYKVKKLWRPMLGTNKIKFIINTTQNFSVAWNMNLFNKFMAHLFPENEFNYLCTRLKCFEYIFLSMNFKVQLPAPFHPQFFVLPSVTAGWVSSCHLFFNTYSPLFAGWPWSKTSSLVFFCRTPNKTENPESQL